MNGLRHQADRRASRAVALVAIVGVHALAVALGLMIKAPRADEPVQADPIVVTLTAAQQRPVAELPASKVVLEQVTPQPVTPVVQITLPAEPAPNSITLAASPAPQPAADVEAGDDPVAVANADYLRLPTVVYPPAARRARAQGLVHVRAVVAVDGRASEVSVARSSGFDLLDRAACDAVRSALFKPYRRNNVARAMVVIVPIDFNLKPAAGPGRDRGNGEDSQLDVGGEHHHPVRGHAEELGGLSAASLHVGE
ncbi:MAG TPA: energy transducer TonB [Steroidobacteraceae bacterium]|nr:energy transducer TonB [Steroidobacteraceae bacterium]